MIICISGVYAVAKAQNVYGDTRTDIFEKIGYTISEVYTLGATGEPVVFIQTALKQLGYYQGETDGIFGAETESALKEFQSGKSGLRVTGECDPVTMYKLADLYLEKNVNYGNEKIYWTNILSELNTNGQFNSGSTVAKIEGEKIIVSGGKVYDVTLSGNLPESVKIVEFDNIVLDGDSIEIDVKNGETLKVVMGKNAADMTDSETNITVYKGGKIDLVIDGSMEYIVGKSEEGGEFNLVHRGVVYDLILVDGNGTIDIVNDGYTPRGIAVNAAGNGRARIENNKNVEGSIQVYAFGESLITVENNATTKSMFLEADESGRAELVNNSDIKQLKAYAYHDGEAEVVNHGRVLNEGYAEDYVHLIADETGKIKFSGSGIVKPGYSIFDYGDQDGDTKHERLPTEPIYIEFWLDKIYKEIREARAAVIDSFRKNIEFPLNKIQTETYVDKVVVVVCFYNPNDEFNSFYIRQAEFYDQETGELLEEMGAFEKLPPVEVPTLVLSSGETLDTTPFLKYEEPNANKNSTVVYNVHLIDQDGIVMDLPEESMLCFPYPEGLDENSANKFKIIIHHYGSEGTETFSTQDGTIELTKQGLCILVSSFSPFEIAWEVDRSSIPQTGDSTHIALWFVLLALTGVAMLTLKRRVQN